MGCVVDSDCGTLSECAKPQCNNTVCETELVKLGTACGATEVCDGKGECLRADGGACVVASECLSAHCADGVCCDSGCSAACESCVLPGALGVCTPLQAGMDPETECGGGLCDGASACALGTVTAAAAYASDPSNALVASVAVAKDGKGFAIGGDYDGTLDLGTGPIPPGGSRNAFVARYDETGAALFARGIGSTSDQWTSAVAFDADDNLIAAGRYWGTADFGGGLRSAVIVDGFVAKYDPMGNYLWDRSLRDTNANQWQEIYGAATLSNGDVVAVGRCYVAIDFGAGDVACNAWDAFAVRLKASDGSVVVGKVFPGDAQDQRLAAVAVDGADNVYVVGAAFGTINFGGGDLVSLGSTDIVVASLDANLDYRWSRIAGSSAEETGTSVAVNKAGRVAIGGYAVGSLDLGGGDMPAAGGYDAVLAAYDEAGVVQYTRRFGDASSQRAWGVAVDDVGNVVLVGSFDGTIDLGTGPLVSAGADGFVAKLSAGGVPLWARRFGDGAVQSFFAVAATGDRGAIVAGELAGSVTLGGATFTSTAGADAFWAKISP